MASVIKDALQEALDMIDLKYKLLEVPSYDLLPLTILDAQQSTKVLEPIGDYFELFNEESQSLKTRTVLELSYTTNKAKDVNLDLTVSFLDGLLKTTKLGKAEISTIFKNVSKFNVELSKVLAIAPRLSQVKKYHRNKKIDQDSNVVKRILDNHGKCGYLVWNSLIIKEVSLSGETDRGVTVKPDITVLSDLFTKLFPKKASPATEGSENEENANEENESTESLSIKGTFKYKVTGDYKLNMKFPDGIIVGIMPKYFHIANDKVTFEVDQDHQERLIAEFKKSLIDPDEPSFIPLV